MINMRDQSLLERLTVHRRALHKIPEPGFKEIKTQNYLLEQINQLDQSHIEIQTWKTGIIVLLKGSKPKKTIGYRADMDGLPIHEETGYEFASIHEGMMHACGHDFHMTIGLSIIEFFVENRPENNIVVIFQPAEEGPGGAKPFLDSKELKKWLPDEIYALHIAPELAVGTIATKPGLLFANTSELFIDLKGIGGHAAYPHLTEDMVIACSHLVTQLQTIVSRNVSPLDSVVVTIGKIEAGTKQNIIAESARLEGTIRTLSAEAMIEVKQRIENLLKGLESSFRCTTSIDYGANYCQVNNDKALSEKFIAFAQNAEEVNFVLSDKAMTGEDFGYFLEEIPGVMFWLGVNSKASLHSASLKPEEKALEIAYNYLTKFLKSR